MNTLYKMMCLKSDEEILLDMIVRNGANITGDDNLMPDDQQLEIANIDELLEADDLTPDDEQLEISEIRRGNKRRIVSVHCID